MRAPPKLCQRNHRGYGVLRVYVAEFEWTDFQSWAQKYGMGGGEAFEAGLRWWISLPREHQIDFIIQSKKIDHAKLAEDRASPTIRLKIWAEAKKLSYHYATTGTFCRAMIRGFVKQDKDLVERFRLAVNMDENLMPTTGDTE